MDIEYKASCKGIWFPGVATLLGMDVGLEAKNSDVVWLEGSQSEWSVSGGVGYTGVNVVDQDHPNNEADSKAPSLNSSVSRIPIASSNHLHPSLANDQSQRPVASASSLLRAPLPSHNVAEYSFEGSRDPAISASSQLGTISSVSGLSQSSATCSPEAPLTLHLNVNDILPPNKTPFTFTIKGTVLVTPRFTQPRANGMGYATADYDETTEPIYVPQFVVWAADAETTKIVVKNDVDQLNATVEVYSPSGDIHKDPQIRKTVLQKGGSTLCGEDGARLVLKVIGSLRDRIHPVRVHTPTGSSQNRVSPNVIRRPDASRQSFDGPSLISSIKAIVTPLISRHRSAPDAYAVRINVNARLKDEDEAGWLEFGLARITSAPYGSKSYSPTVHIACVSVDGVPARYEITEAVRPILNESDPVTASFEKVGGMDWVNWVKIQVDPSDGDNVAIDYVVKLEPPPPTWFSKQSDFQRWGLLLPTFSLPVEKFEVSLVTLTGTTFKFIFHFKS